MSTRPDPPPRRTIPSTRPDSQAREPGASRLGVLNPFAVADLVIGMRVPWRHIDSPHLLLQAVFGTPFPELFSPAEEDKPWASRNTLLYARTREEARAIERQQLKDMGHPNPYDVLPDRERLVPQGPGVESLFTDESDLNTVSEDPKQSATGQDTPLQADTGAGNPTQGHIPVVGDTSGLGLAASHGAPLRGPLTRQQAPLLFTYRGQNLTWTHDPHRLMAVLDQALPLQSNGQHHSPTQPLELDHVSDPTQPPVDTSTVDTSTVDTSTVDTSTVDVSIPDDMQAPTMWVDPGDLLVAQPGKPMVSVSDPVQGNVGNCYLIAALSAIAFAAPEIIHPGATSLSLGDQDATRVSFWDPDDGGAPTLAHPITVTESLQVWASSGIAVFAHSTQPTEIWPGVYEKAFAAYLTGDTDKPDIIATALGEPALTLRQLTGRNTTTWALSDLRPDEIMTVIRDHCDGGKTLTHPAVTWTWPSSSVASQHTGTNVSYVDYNLVAAHAYTLLGWETLDGRDVIVLRNPFGQRKLDALTIKNATPALDLPTWAPYAQDHGVFAIDLAHFHSHFKKMSITD